MVNPYRFGVAVTSFSMSFKGQTLQSVACSDALDTTRYHDGTGSVPSDGDTVYTTDPGTPSTTYNGGGKHSKISAFTTAVISTSGVVSGITIC